MLGSRPKVSVYMPTHNRREMLERAIKSVLNQTMADFELIVVNDASTDDTKTYLECLAEVEPRLTVFHNETPQGACLSRNRAILAAKAEYATGLDDDDEFLPQRLELLLKAMSDKYAFVTAGYYWDYGKKRTAVDTANVEIELQHVLGHQHANNQALARTQDLITIGMFDPSMPACQDWDIWTRLIAFRGIALRIAQPLYIVHTAHDSPRISVSANKQLQALTTYFNKHQHLMEPEAKRRMQTFIFMKEGKVFSLKQLFTELPATLRKAYVKYLLKKLFPALFEYRLRRLKTNR